MSGMNSEHCVICGEPTSPGDPEVCVFLEDDVRTRGFGLNGVTHISFHMTCELGRQRAAESRRRRLAAVRVIRRGMRWRRRLRLWGRFFGWCRPRGKSGGKSGGLSVWDEGEL